MKHILTALNYFCFFELKHEKHCSYSNRLSRYIRDATRYFPATLNLNMSYIVVALSFFLAPLSGTHFSFSEHCSSYSELKYERQRSCSEQLPSYSELKHETHRSYSKLLSSYSQLVHDTHDSCSELPSSCSELKHDTCRNCFQLYPSWSLLKHDT